MTANKLEGKARELLAAEMDADGRAFTARQVRAGKTPSVHIAQSLRAIVRALDTARQSEGMVLVPREPTEAMIVAGFESEPDPVFSSLEEWEKYDAMSGCRQAAHRARLCWAAMLAAADAGEG